MIRKLSLARAIFWAVLIIPSFFFGWVYSVAFVSICSLYANTASDFASWRADDYTELQEQLDRLENKLNQLHREIKERW